MLQLSPNLAPGLVQLPPQQSHSKKISTSYSLTNFQNSCFLPASPATSRKIIFNFSPLSRKTVPVAPPPPRFFRPVPLSLIPLAANLASIHIAPRLSLVYHRSQISGLQHLPLSILLPSREQSNSFFSYFRRIILVYKYFCK